MDASDFIVHPNLAGSGLMKSIEDLLLHEMNSRYIRAELYKLNIYGEYFHEAFARSSDITAFI